MTAVAKRYVGIDHRDVRAAATMKQTLVGWF